MSSLDKAFGPPAKHPDERYVTRAPHRNWSQQETFALLPIILNSPNEPAYNEALVWIGRLLGHPANYAPTQKPNTQEQIKDAVSVINDHIVTRVLRGHTEDTAIFARWAFTGVRTGLPLTWGEKFGILQRYARKPTTDRKRIKIEPLLDLLERRKSDQNLVSNYVDTVTLVLLQGRPAPTEPPDARESLVAPHRIHVLETCVRHFVDAEVSDEFTLTTAWMNLHEEAMKPHKEV